MKAELEAPPRLIDAPGAAGDCLRSAIVARDRTAGPPPFHVVRERRLRRAQRRLAFGSIAVAALALLGSKLLLHREEEPTTVRAEAFVPSRPAPLPALLDSAQPPLTTEPSAQPSARPKPKPAALRLAAKPLSVRAALAPLPVPSVAAPVDSSPGSGSARACAELARGGAAESALACYEGLADGSGMTAELALFEQARLEGKALRRPDRALKTLGAYRQRFPNGSLRPEVMLARIEWLLRAGEPEQALQAVDEALASGLLRERTAELERLRGSLTSAQ